VSGTGGPLQWVRRIPLGGEPGPWALLLMREQLQGRECFLAMTPEQQAETWPVDDPAVTYEMAAASPHAEGGPE
jgi:hypothetical protein